jgi:hypothetical protein
MLNPSTADCTVNDPTIKRCMKFTMSWGFTIMQVVNLFAFRATDPKNLPWGHDEASGPDNDVMTLSTLMCADRVVCAWGAQYGTAYRAKRVMTELMPPFREPLCLGLTKDGHPRHPLYLRDDTKLEPYVHRC